MMHRNAVRLLLFVIATISIGQPLVAQQTTLVLDNKRSLVWWQLDPHYGHLWATSCPLDPSWQPGEGHSAGYIITNNKRPKIKLTKESAARFPLFPRDTVHAVCRSAVNGQVTTTDPKQFSNLRGTVVVNPDSITNGSDMRDAFARKYIFSAAKYPTIKFTIDSLTAVRMVGDTVNAIAVGIFELRGVERPTRVQVQGVQDPAGLRVRGLFAMPARELQDRYQVSRAVLTMGVGSKLWDTLYMGFDLILRPR